MLHSRSLTFMHPVRKEMMSVVAPVPTNDNLWEFFDSAVRADEE
jgi:23S rRNA pseudouridine1911/1915/1917 synthase